MKLTRKILIAAFSRQMELILADLNLEVEFWATEEVYV